MQAAEASRSCIPSEYPSCRRTFHEPEQVVGLVKNEVDAILASARAAVAVAAAGRGA